MAKQKISPEKMAQALAQPSIYKFTLKDVSTSSYNKALDMLKQNVDYAAIEDKRNKLVQASDRLRPGTSEMQSILQQIRKYDSQLAKILFSALVQTHYYSVKTDDNLKFSTLLKYFVDYSNPEMKKKADDLCTNLNTVSFLSDYIDSVITDIKGDMITLFGPDIKFNQFNLVQQTLHQLNVFFNSTRSTDSNSPAAILFEDYADSISSYLNKRFKTFVRKYNKIHPPVQIHTVEDLIEGVKQFFGDEQKFDERIIGHTESNGLYINIKSLTSLLNAEQTVKLERIAKHFVGDECKSFDPNLNFSFQLSDAIMSKYVKPKKDE